MLYFTLYFSYLLSWKNGKLMNILSCDSLGSETQQHRGKVRLYPKDPGFRSGQDSSYGSADDTICGDTLLQSPWSHPGNGISSQWSVLLTSCRMPSWHILCMLNGQYHPRFAGFISSFYRLSNAFLALIALQFQHQNVLQGIRFVGNSVFLFSLWWNVKPVQCVMSRQWLGVFINFLPKL